MRFFGLFSVLNRIRFWFLNWKGVSSIWDSHFKFWYFSGQIFSDILGEWLPTEPPVLQFHGFLLAVLWETLLRCKSFMNLGEGLATESTTVLGEVLATESAVLQECSSTTLACLQEACNTNKLSRRTADSVAKSSPRLKENQGRVGQKCVKTSNNYLKLREHN